MSAKIEAWFEALPDLWQERAQRLRTLLLEASPAMREEWKYNTPFYCNGRWMCYLSLQKQKLVLGFVDGIDLLDAEGLFAHTDHRSIRHYLPPEPPSRMNEPALRRLIAEASLLSEERKALKQARRRR
jgi:hypothetical protein